jgi:hypothetical protein
VSRPRSKYSTCQIQLGSVTTEPNGSKTAVMDVIGILCVSLGSSTVQLHDSLRSKRACAYTEAGFSSQNCDLA